MKHIRLTINFLSAVIVFLSLPATFAADTTGITDTEIKIGAHTSESGKGALSSAYAIAVRTYFANVNAEGGVHGRKIKWLAVDTQSIEAKSYEATRTLVEQDKIFAMVGAQGPSHLAVWKYLKEKKVPDIFLTSSDEDYIKPLSKTVFPASYVAKTEGDFVARYAVQNFKGKKVCWFITNDAISEQYDAATKAAVNEENAKLPQNERMIVGATEKVERMATQANSEMLKLNRAKCEVILARPYGPVMAAAINFAGSQGFNPVWMLQFANVTTQFLDLIKSLPEKKIYGLMPFAVTDGMGAYNFDAYKKWLIKNGLRDTGSSARGFYVGELFVEALKRAGKNLSRESIVEAIEGLGGYKCSLCAAPIELSPTQHQPVKSPLVFMVKDGKWSPAKKD